MGWQAPYEHSLSAISPSSGDRRIGKAFVSPPAKPGGVPVLINSLIQSKSTKCPYHLD